MMTATELMSVKAVQPVIEPWDQPVRSWPTLAAPGVFMMIALAILLGGCAEKKIEVAHDEAIHIPAVKVKKQVLQRIDQLPGEILAYQDVAIYPKVAGFIEKIDIDRGSIVKKGQVLVTMFAPEFLATRAEYLSKAQAASASLHEAESKLLAARATLLEMKAKLAGDTDTYTRTKDASMVPGVVAANEVIVLRDMVKSDEERVGNAQENVKACQNQVGASKESESAARKAANNYLDIAAYLTVTAPFDGYITERNMHVGSFVGPLGKGAYQPIVRIQQLNLLRIVTPVPERDVGGIVAGAEVPFTVSTYPSRIFTGTIARLGNYLEQKTRTEPVELNYWNTDGKVKPGMFCEVLWPTKRTGPSLFVPITSVATTTYDTFVDKIENGVVKWVKVKRGQTMGKWVEVFGELQEGDTVSVTGTDELREGETIDAVIANTADVEKDPEPRPGYRMHGVGQAVSQDGRLSSSEQDKQAR